MTGPDEATALLPDLIDLRRALHREPEVGLHLPRTQQRVLDALAGLPLDITLGRRLSSITAVLRGRTPGPPVLLRADMDALPIAERSGEPFSSVTDAMHACGHDLHTAALVGAARLLSSRRGQLAGDVVFMFQPGEEAGDGAALMIEEGVLEAAGRRPHAAYGLHVMPGSLPAGTFASRPGPLMASVDALHVRVLGEGGHGSQPHLAKDPIHALCEIVTALQGMVTRQFDVFDPVVLTVGRIAGGTRENVIPDDAQFDATIRTFSPASRDKVRAAATRVCQGVAEAHGVGVDVRYRCDLPPTVNDVGEAQFVADTATSLFGEQRWQLLPHPHSGAEDFSRILDEVPGAYTFLGTCATGDPQAAPNLHASTARFDDRWLADAASLLCELAWRRPLRAQPGSGVATPR